MRRRTLLVVLAGLAVVIAAGVVVLWPRPSRLTQDNCNRVREGMSRAEVEEVLGVPGDYRTKPAFPGENFIHFSQIVRDFDLERHNQKCWIGDGLFFLAGFDDEGKVVTASVKALPSLPVGFWESLLWRANRQWHRWFP